MTNKQAIEVLTLELWHTESHKKIEGKATEYYEELSQIAEALKMAIKALKNERPQGEWVGINEYLKHIEETTGEKYKTSGLYNGRLFCNKCWKMSELMIKTNFCYECGADMRETDNDKVN